MKQILLLCLLISYSAFSSQDEIGLKSSPSFMVISSEKDPSLKAKEAVFEFEFMNDEFKQANGRTLIIQSSYNQISHEIQLDSSAKHVLKVTPGTYAFQFYAAYYFEEIYSDSVLIKPGYRTKIQLRFTEANQLIISDKPVIYLYPPADLAVTTIVQPTGAFTFTYPSYEKGWKGIAHPDGSITINQSTYPYLFWEAKNTISLATIDLNEGFVVIQEQTILFLEEQLTKMGLNSREKTDFITYWGPRMIGNQRNFVQFLFNDTCNQFADLQIDPTPEQLFRVYMIWFPLTEESTFSPQPQVIQTINREQFYAIEWGGSELSTLKLP